MKKRFFKKLCAAVGATMLFASVWAQTVTIPSANTNTSGNRKPYGCYFGYERTAAIYTSAEIGYTGNITDIAFYLNSVSSPAASTPVMIYMKQTSVSDFATSTTVATEETGATLVYTGNITSAMLTANSWVNVTLTTPFAYSNASNLEVIIEANFGGSGGEGSTSKQFRYSNTPGLSTQTWQSDNTAPTGTGSTSSSRPNVQLTFLLPPCAGTPTAGTAAAAPASVCGSGSFNLSTTGFTSNAAGITFQWQSASVSGGPYTNIPTANSATYNTGTISSTTYYVCVVTCSNSTLSATTNEVAAVVNAVPTVSVTPTAGSLCQGATTPVSLVASGAVSYDWLPTTGLSASTGSNVDALPGVTTNYTVTGTAANGCTATATASITVTELPSLTALTSTPASACIGGNAQLNAAAGTSTAYTQSTPAFGTEACPVNAGPSGDDQVQGNNAIGFTFNYFGVAYTQFGISTNGNVQLGDGSGTANNPSYSSAWSDIAIPNTGTPNNMIALAWDDWYVNAGGITWGVSGSAPNRRLIVCYNTTSRGSGSSDTLIGQVVLEEGTNNIYLNITKKGIQPGNSATQGIENQDGTVGSAVAGRQNTGWSANNQTVLFSPSGGSAVYAWSPSTFLSSTNIANPVANAMTAGTTYTVTATISGCTAIDSIQVAVNPLPVVNLGADVTQCGGSVTLDAQNAGATYLWSDASTNQTLTVSAADTVSVTVTDANGCMNSDTVVLTINPLPVLNLGADVVQCGGSVTLDAQNAGATYLWSDASTNQTLTVSATDTVDVTVTDANGCVNSDTIAITINAIPVVNLGADVTQCGGSVTLDAQNAGATYSWSDASTNQTLTVVATDTVDVAVTDANGCQNSDTVVVTINPLPVVNLGADVVQCGGSVTLDAQNAGATYLWSDASTNQTLIVSATDTVDVTVTDANGCVNSDTVAITINAVPVVNLGADTMICGTAYTLDAGNPGSTYIWSDASTGQTLTLTGSGTVSVIVASPAGCTASDSIIVTLNTPPTVGFSFSVSTMCIDDAMVTLTGGTPAGGSFSGPGVSGSTFSAVGAGVGAQVITYTYTDVNGCSGSAVHTIAVDSCLAVSEATLAQNVMLFPNPTNGLFLLSLNSGNYSSFTIEVFTVQGRLVYSDKAVNVGQGYAHPIDLSTLANGTYVVKVTTENETMMKKVIKQD